MRRYCLQCGVKLKEGMKYYPKNKAIKNSTISAIGKQLLCAFTFCFIGNQENDNISKITIVF